MFGVLATKSSSGLNQFSVQFIYTGGQSLQVIRMSHLQVRPGSQPMSQQDKSLQVKLLSQPISHIVMYRTVAKEKDLVITLHLDLLHECWVEYPVVITHISRFDLLMVD